MERKDIISEEELQNIKEYLLTKDTITIAEMMNKYNISYDKACSIIDILFDDGYLEEKRTMLDDFLSLSVSGIGIDEEINIDDRHERCTFCNKLFDYFDYMDLEKIDHYFGYGSHHDGGHMYMCLCASCFDKVVDLIAKTFKKDLIEEGEW